MIKVKLNDLLNDYENLKELLKVKMPIKASYWINRISKNVFFEIEAFEEKRGELVKSLGKKDKNEIWEVKKENIDKFKKQIKELGTIEIDLPFELVDISLLEEVELEPHLVLSWLFTSN